MISNLTGSYSYNQIINTIDYLIPASKMPQFDLPFLLLSIWELRPDIQKCLVFADVSVRPTRANEANGGKIRYF